MNQIDSDPLLLTDTLRVYEITVRPKFSDLLPFTWQVTLSGFGETTGSTTPTWQSSGQDETFAAALEKAIAFAPAQRQVCNERGKYALIPDYDPEGLKPKRSRTKSSGPKLSLDDLTALLNFE